MTLVIVPRSEPHSVLEALVGEQRLILASDRRSSTLATSRATTCGACACTASSGACRAATPTSLTPDGIRVAVFYTKLQDRLLRPLLDADKPPAPIEVRRAFTTLERAVNDYIHSARLAPAA